MIARMLPIAVSAVMALACNLAHAIPPIPQQSGWSGHIGLGVGGGRYESNMVAEIGPIDLGKDRVSSIYQSPDDENVTLPALPFEVAYTFADSGTQLFLGSREAEHFTFEVDTALHIQFGARQSFPEVGEIALAYVVSTVPTDVWKDPYVAGDARGDTQRTSNGVAIEWDDIFSTPLALVWTSTQVEIDDEESGRQGDLGLTADQQRALRREGQVYRVELNYDWRLNERHSLVPGIGYIDQDLDGAAMAQDGLLLQLKHVYDPGGWSLVSKVYLEDLNSDESNPIYGDGNDVQTLGGSITAYFEKPLGLQDWTASAGASYYEGNSNNDFYDTSLALFSVGMLYRF
jgi:hypothetical protein